MAFGKVPYSAPNLEDTSMAYLIPEHGLSSACDEAECPLSSWQSIYDNTSDISREETSSKASLNWPDTANIASREPVYSSIAPDDYGCASTPNSTVTAPFMHDTNVHQYPDNTIAARTRMPNRSLQEESNIVGTFPKNSHLPTSRPYLQQHTAPLLRQDLSCYETTHYNFVHENSRNTETIPCARARLADGVARRDLNIAAQAPQAARPNISPSSTVYVEGIAGRQAHERGSYDPDLLDVWPQFLEDTVGFVKCRYCPTRLKDDWIHNLRRHLKVSCRGRSLPAHLCFGSALYRE